jgi:hypothetical protein
MAEKVRAGASFDKAYEERQGTNITLVKAEFG